MSLTASIICFLYQLQHRQIGQNLESIQYRSESFQNLLSSQLAIQEYTFGNISREIHDNISLSLTLSKLTLNTINWDDKDIAVQKVESAVKLIGETISDLGKLSKTLSSDYIAMHGLIHACELEVEKIRSINSYDVQIQKRGHQIFMSNAKELMIFRILQEALHNILKHAAATLIRVKLHYHQKYLFLHVIDNGRGFSALSETSSQNGSGLQNMKTRALLLGGTMKVKSTISLGTSLLFKIPLNHG